MPIDPHEARARLAEARLMLLFTPRLCAREPLEALECALPHVQIVQVRIKDEQRPLAPGPAGELLAWCERVLECVRGRALVLVNDRVEVALALAQRGLAGVHLGQDDLPPPEARALLGPEALIGWSTHSPEQVARAEELPVDYLGYGPIFASETKGVREGQGAQAAWIAQAGARVPVFPIGGIDAINAAELAPVGRAAVSRAILADADPARAAREIALQLQSEGD